MSAEHEIKIAVERIVRPIRARESDKLRMRRELYLHATEAYHEEVSAGVSEADGARKAIERLGDANEVRSELQATVFWISRLDYWTNRLLTRPAGTSVIAHAAKKGVWLAGGITLGFMVLLSLPYLFFTQKVCNGQICELIGFWEVWPKLFAMGGRVFPMFALATFNALIFAESMGGTEDWIGRGRRIVRQALAVVVVLLVQASVLVSLFALAGDSVIRNLPTYWEGVFAWLAFFTLIFASVLSCLSALDTWRRSRHAEWLDLDLNPAVAE